MEYAGWCDQPLLTMMAYFVDYVLYMSVMLILMCIPTLVVDVMAITCKSLHTHIIWNPVVWSLPPYLFIYPSYFMFKVHPCVMMPLSILIMFELRPYSLC